MSQGETLPQQYDRRWDVLLIGGVSGSGKTTAAAALARRLVIPWLGVDDLRLAFQWSRVRLPERTEDLYFFTDTPDLWSLPPERLYQGLVTIGELMAPAVEIVVANHLDNAGPIIIEGDGILPSIIERYEVRTGIDANRVRCIFVHEPDPGRLLENYRNRKRGPVDRPDSELDREARSKSLLSNRVAAEAAVRGLPVIPSQPFGTLIERILQAAS